ncbi:MAG: glycosyltransferase family 4 protein [Planctomycetales bacterium]|nr:glycosyltransferase family 4 protein [Planctomycetales bacterium]
MKVLILNNAVPFVWGGAEELAHNLNMRLNALSGIEAEILRIPFAWEPKERLAAEILLNRSFSLHNVDRVIALKFPAYLVPHDQKTIWLLHQFRQAYDLLEGGQSYLRHGVDDELIDAVVTADNQCFATARRVFTNSPVTRDRLKRFNGQSGEVLYPPLNDEELFVGGSYGDYLFAGGRVARGKRQHLLIEAMRLTDSHCKLVVAGPVTDKDYADDLISLVEKYDMSSRVLLQLRLHTRAEIASLATGSLASAYIPYDEDSLGYVTMEAFASARAVLTTTDSGGLLEIVRPNQTGWVCKPEPEQLAGAINSLFADRRGTIDMGRSAYSTWTTRGINWSHTLERLLS